jgi:hypothetical protein
VVRGRAASPLSGTTSAELPARRTSGWTPARAGEVDRGDTAASSHEVEGALSAMARWSSVADLVRSVAAPLDPDTRLLLQDPERASGLSTRPGHTLRCVPLVTPMLARNAGHLPSRDRGDIGSTTGTDIRRPPSPRWPSSRAGGAGAATSRRACAAGPTHPMTAPPTVTPLQTPPTASPLPTSPLTAAPAVPVAPTAAGPRSRTVEPAPSAEPNASGPSSRSRRASLSATRNPEPPARELPPPPSR